MMIRLGCTIALTVLVSMVAGAPAASAAEGRIVGGEKVPADTFASTYTALVSVQLNSSGRSPRSPILYTHVCGGTVIAPTLVLTAAHCVSSDSPTPTGTGYSVLPRRASLAGRSTAGAVGVTDVFVHPEFGGPGSPYSSYFFGGQATPAYDVAVLRLAAPIDGVTPIPLVQASEDAATWGAGFGRATGAIALGWGQTTAPGFGRGNRGADLRSVGMTIRADRRCERSDDGLGADANGFNADTMLCAGTADGPSAGNSAKAMCFGDSGGPLLAPAADGSLRVVGTSSWTPSFAPCATWSVFARVGSLRDWIASIPAQGTGVAGIDGPDTLTATPVDSNSLRIAWPAPATGTPDRYRIYRSATPGRFGYFGFGPVPKGLSLAAITDAVDRTIVLDGIAPRRPGARRTHTIRIDAQDAEGNRGAGVAVTVNAPIDAKRPTAAGTPNIRPLGRRGTYVGFSPATDNDCIGRYVVQVRGDHGWRNLNTWRNQSCDQASLIPTFGYGYWGGYGIGRTANIQALKFPLRGLGAGTWRIRIVAIDRAGNSSRSRSRVFELNEAIKGGRYGTCIGSAGSTFCGASVRSGSGVHVVIR